MSQIQFQKQLIKLRAMISSASKKVLHFIIKIMHLGIHNNNYFDNLQKLNLMERKKSKHNSKLRFSKSKARIYSQS